jgi:ferrous iron transport protein B
MNAGALSASDKIDKIVTNRWLGLPIFAIVMYLVYWIAMVGVGAPATDWANDGLFGDGFHLFGMDGGYGEISESYADASAVVDGYDAYVEENGAAPSGDFEYSVTDDETLEVSEETASLEDYEEAKKTLEEIGDEPDPADYGTWIPGIPALIESGLDAAGTADWLKGLILDGIVAGVGAVLGFVPQMLVLFLMLAFLEACGYMARIAFVLDRVFRKFGLSGKSFIPMLIGVGCGVPGVMASRTIENERDRRMTIITTTFIPCGAKVPFIAMIAGAIFGGSAWVSTSAYFIGMAAIVISGIMLKKTKMFAGDPAPFVMELPSYHLPAWGNVLRGTWERGWSFIKRAGTVIVISSIVIWFLTSFGSVNGTFGMVDALYEDEDLVTDEYVAQVADRMGIPEDEVEPMDDSILARVAQPVSVVFKPLGFGDWKPTAATVTGLVAKEEVVANFGIMYAYDDQEGEEELEENGDQIWDKVAEDFNAFSGGHGKLAAFAFMIFNLLCAPCFAAMGAIKREMNSAKWTWFAIAYQCGFAWVMAFIVWQVGRLFAGGMNVVGLVIALVMLGLLLWQLFKPYKEAQKLTVK